MKSRVIIIILSALLVLSLAFNAIMILARITYVNGSLETDVTGTLAPDFSVQLLTGETFTLSEHRGTVVVLDFWATWCGPCVLKMPTIQALSEQFEGEVIFIGMNVGEFPERIQNFIAERNFTYPIGLDESAEIYGMLSPTSFLSVPYMVIINGDGIITETFSGYGPGNAEIYERAILEALG